MQSGIRHGVGAVAEQPMLRLGTGQAANIYRKRGSDKRVDCHVHRGMVHAVSPHWQARKLLIPNL
jgi:hypothetical protein